MATDFSKKINTLHRVYPAPKLSANLRAKPEDFRVTEQLSFSPSGSGEHLFLKIEKTSANTEWVAKRLQKTFGLSSREIGYAGKKDRHSIATQWFSLHLPGKKIELDKLALNQEFKVLNAVRHNKKLKIGSLKENKFEIVLRNITGKIDERHLEQISKQGVPNYFGYQRFGFDANNLVVANDYLSQKIKIKNRNKRSMVISSARSLLFNLILSKRIENKTWIRVLDGDCLMLDGSQSYFVVNKSTCEDQQRVESGDVHICGLLAGRQVSDAQSLVKELEDKILARYPDWMDAFYRLNLSTSRRPLRCIPRELTVEYKDNKAVLNFNLNKGCYATSVIKELVNIVDVSLEGKNKELAKIEN
ncbi:MAG: tRNA pseudouridine(13) synthase TruD [Kangiellaceae bacterium]|nr:tRNA pseudouridine(13) synthase TruD [Kangiellaceae bacterium]